MGFPDFFLPKLDVQDLMYDALILAKQQEHPLGERGSMRWWVLCLVANACKVLPEWT